jgi:hypothetical protein
MLILVVVFLKDSHASPVYRLSESNFLPNALRFPKEHCFFEDLFNDFSELRNYSAESDVAI